MIRKVLKLGEYNPPKTIAMIRNKGIELEYIGNRPVKILRYIGDAKEIEISESE